MKLGSKSLVSGAASVTLILLLSACIETVGVMNGLYLPAQQYSDQELLWFGNQLGIPNSLAFKLDTGIFIKIKAETDSAVQEEKARRWLSPAQARYYDETGTLQSHITFPKNATLPVDWEENGRFGEYPPQSMEADDSLRLHFNEIIPFIHPISGKLTKAQPCEMVLVFWSRTMWKPSKDLISSVRNNLLRQGKADVPIYYVNTDHLMLKAAYRRTKWPK